MTTPSYTAYGDGDDRIVVTQSTWTGQPRQEAAFRPRPWSPRDSIPRRITDPNATSRADRRAIGVMSLDDILTRLTGRTADGRFAARRSLASHLPDRESFGR